MEAAGGKQILATEQLQKNGDYVWNDYVVRKEFAEKYPDIVVKFLQTYEQTVEMYNQDRKAWQAGRPTPESERAAVRDTMAGLYFPLFKEQLSASCWAKAATSLRRCSTPRASWSSWAT